MIQNENELRQKLARELHDGPTQKVAGVGHAIGLYQSLARFECCPKPNRNYKARAHRSASHQRNSHRFVHLRPLALESKGLSAAFAQYGERMREAEEDQHPGLAGRIRHRIGLELLPPLFLRLSKKRSPTRASTATMRRLWSVYNARKFTCRRHPRPGSRFRFNARRKRMTSSTSLGLQNMRERAGLIDGDLPIVTRQDTAHASPSPSPCHQ